MNKVNKDDKQPDANPSWDHINQELKSALDTWSDLNDQLADKLSPEEEQLREIKSILGTIKDKLKAFSDDEVLETFQSPPSDPNKAEQADRDPEPDPNK